MPHSSSSLETNVLIIGGGLAGLSLADHLSSIGRDYLLVEARDRLGGRILTYKTASTGFDLGPAWFWPGQARMAKLVQRLNLEYFEQYSTGELMAEDRQGNARRGSGWASMEGSYRIEGGMGELIDRLYLSLPPNQILTEHKATQINQTNSGISVLVERAHGTQVINANNAVLALPPRVAATSLTYRPDLAERTRDAMLQTPTWMAGHAKIVAIYDRPHWREAGLSGDAMSQCGPMVEIHDASPDTDGLYALFGFLGIGAKARRGREPDIKQAAKHQLVRMFGDNMAHPREMILQDWAQDPLTAIPLDGDPPGIHPHYGRPEAMSGLWNGRLILGSTELGTQFGGYLEGALEVADYVAQSLSLE